MEQMDFAVESRAPIVARRAWAAQHSACPPESLASLSLDSSARVRREVAGNVNTPAVALEHLSHDADKRVREAVAGNRSAPTRVLVELIADARWSVRWAVVKNPATDQDVQEAICRSTDSAMRALLAEVETVPAEIALRLLKDPDVEVRHRLAAHTPVEAILDQLVQDSAPRVRWGLALNFHTGERRIRVLAKDHSWEVRAVVAQMPRLPVDIYELISADSSVAVRDHLAAAGHAPQEILTDLLRDPSHEVRGHARRALARSRGEAPPVRGSEIFP